VAATAEQKMVCGLQYPRSGVRIKSSNLIEIISSFERVNCDNKIKLGVSPIELAVGLEGVVG